jgi:hypothetical protein
MIWAYAKWLASFPAKLELLASVLFVMLIAAVLIKLWG